MTTHNENQKTSGAILLHGKSGNEIITFEGEEGRARAYLSILEKHLKAGYYGERPDILNFVPVPEECLNEEELKYFNLTDEEIKSANLPDVVITDMEEKRQEILDKYTAIVTAAKEDNWLWQSLAKIIDAPEDEKAKLGHTKRNGKFVSLAESILLSRSIYRYQGFEEFSNLQNFA